MKEEEVGPPLVVLRDRKRPRRPLCLGAEGGGRRMDGMKNCQCGGRCMGSANCCFESHLRVSSRTGTADLGLLRGWLDLVPLILQLGSSSS